VPRGALVILAVLLLAAIGLAAAGRHAATPPAAPDGRAIASRALAFADHDDGSVSITDAADGSGVATLAPGTGAFIRATLRGLVRERRMDGHGPAAPFRLTAWSDGRLTLQDQATGRIIDIVAFGPTQVEAFARLLPAGRTAP
jgi:putative photosynthetic complex assembly protein